MYNFSPKISKQKIYPTQNYLKNNDNIEKIS